MNTNCILDPEPIHDGQAMDNASLALLRKQVQHLIDNHAALTARSIFDTLDWGRSEVHNLRRRVLQLESVIADLNERLANVEKL